MPDFTRLPSVYNLKFALLHLIQASELLLKSYVERCEPSALFVRPGSGKTIDFQTALNFTTERNPNLLSPAELVLLMQAKGLRNSIEHYQIEFREKELRSLCIDFLAICILIAQALLSINIADAFSWNYLTDKPDEVARYISTAIRQVSDTGRSSLRKTGESWALENSSEPVFLCLNCGARAVSQDRGVCMGCGIEGNDEELVTLMEDFRAAERRIAYLQKLLDR